MTSRLHKIPDFSLIKKCYLNLDNVQYNINDLDKNQLIYLLCRLRSLETEKGFLEIEEDLFISGFKIQDWIIYLWSKYQILKKKNFVKKI